MKARTLLSMPRDHSKVVGTLTRFLDKLLCESLQRNGVVGAKWMSTSARRLVHIGLKSSGLAVPEGDALTTNVSAHLQEYGYAPVAELLKEFLGRRGKRVDLEGRFGDVVDWVSRPVRSSYPHQREDLVEKLVCVLEEHDSDATVSLFADSVVKCCDVCTDLEPGGGGAPSQDDGKDDGSESDGEEGDDNRSRSAEDDLIFEQSSSEDDYDDDEGSGEDEDEDGEDEEDEEDGEEEEQSSDGESGESGESGQEATAPHRKRKRAQEEDEDDDEAEALKLAAAARG